MTVGEALRGAAEELRRTGADSPRLDAELILAHVLGCSRLALYTRAGRELSAGERAAARALLRRRARREPLAYVLGEWGFRSLTLRTDARALVPRPETEELVGRALALIAAVERPRVADVGTGSGAIALALAAERPDAEVVATDCSPAAVALARENAARLRLAVDVREASLLDGVEGPLDLVVSNPPYVLPGEPLAPELAFEPPGALIDAGQTEALARAARERLDGVLVVEVHAARARAVAGLLARLGYTDVAITRDLAGKERIVEGRWTR